MNHSIKYNCLTLFVLIIQACFSLGFQPDSGLAREQNKEQMYIYALISQTKGDMDSAIHLFNESAEKGYDMAQYSLGNVYFHGKSVAQDYSVALKWYLLAANQGNISAQVATGVIYARGLGTKQDYVEANKWFLNAGNKGNAVAQFNMGTAYDHGLGIKKDYTQAFNWFLRAAEHGIAQAQLIVGTRYAEGQGTRQDLLKAYFWINKAADQEFPPAIVARDEIAEMLTPTQIAAALNEDFADAVGAALDSKLIPESDQ